MFTDHHTAARLLTRQTDMGVGSAFARPWVTDGAALAVGGVCPNPAVKRTGVGISRGDPAPS
ncbi:MAG: hypothetical protein ABFS41_11480 [Myxococcota bacterium]